MRVAEVAERVVEEVGRAVVGQRDALEQLLVAVLADGHVLLEGVPGLAKTLLVRTLARVFDLSYGRVQFTPDLMPSDLLGTNVFDPRTAEFRFRTGPIFAAVLLADEINRTPPKTQAALLEAMEERAVTVDGVRYPLPEPFLVCATQNPIEFEGTYPLPEAQQDRFLMKVVLTYPRPEEEIQVLRNYHAGFRSQHLDEAGVRPVVDLSLLGELRAEVNAVSVEDKIFEYVFALVDATRSAADVLLGASPRAGLALLACAKALAALRDRSYVIPDDVKTLALPVMRHRVLLRPEAEVEGVDADRVLASLVERQLVPR